MKKGFTLIEFVCVLAIIAVVAAFTCLNLKAIIGKSTLESSADMLVADLRFAKMNAISNNTDTNVLFIKDDLGKNFNRYVIYEPANLVNMIVKNVDLPSNICVERKSSTFDTSGRLVFNTIGSVSPFACTIVLRDRNTGESAVITLTIGYTRIMRVD